MVRLGAFTNEVTVPYIGNIITVHHDIIKVGIFKIHPHALVTFGFSELLISDMLL